MSELVYNAPPTIAAFLDSDAFVRCVVGPIGSGKSSGCVVEILRRAREQAPGPDGVRRTRFAVVRNTYRELEDTTRKTFEQWIPAGLGEWHEQDFAFVIDRPGIHCEVLFRALDRPQDVKKLLSLELTGCYFNELREVAKPIFDGMQGRVGRYPARKDGGPTWFGVWGDTNPWDIEHWGYQLFSLELPEEFALFEQPDGLSPEAENVENLPPRYYERLTAGKDAEWIDCYVRGKYPKRVVGSVYGALLGALRERGGILNFQFAPTEIFTSWDLGFSDATGIWFWRVGPNGLPEVVDHYENHGEPLSHYFSVVDGKGYRYAKHFLPHDARAKSLLTGGSVVEQFAQRYGVERVAITPELSLQDGLTAGRWLLEQDIRIHATNCADGLKALNGYRYKWDEKRQVYSKTPVHDMTSHTADAWRYLACAYRPTEQAKRPPPKPKPVEAKPYHLGFTMDELWEANRPKRSTGRI